MYIAEGGVTEISINRNAKPAIAAILFLKTFQSHIDINKGFRLLCTFLLRAEAFDFEKDKTFQFINRSYLSKEISNYNSFNLISQSMHNTRILEK